MKTRYFVLFAVLMALFSSPVLAGTQYMAGSPQLSASLLGDTEYLPGDEVTLTVVIHNSGLNDIKIIQQNIDTSGELPNTAKMVSATLSAGDALLIVKTDPQMIGDIPGGSSTPVPFTVKIPTDAPSGTFSLHLDVGYTYLFDTEQIGMESIIYHYRTENESLEIPFTIKKIVSIDVVDVRTEHINVGSEGYVTITINNTGYLTGKSTIARISRSGSSPVVPVDSSVYIGDFSPGQSVPCRYKVMVTGNGGAQTYPLDIAVVYQNTEGETVTSDPVSMGVPVNGKVDFDIVSPASVIYPGSTEKIIVEYENTGAATVYSAQARISAAAPFSSTDDTASLGDMKPGDRVTAEFGITADKSATAKEYGLDSEIRYRDDLDKSRISDTMKVTVAVRQRSGIDFILHNAVLMSIIIAALIGAGYFIYTKRRKK
jgi:hypothetical protein